MAEQLTPDQAKVSDALIASGAVIPFERLKWTDFPLETRLRALRALLAASARLRERRLAAAAEAVGLKAA
jgi:hypothetical protein